MLVVTTAAGDRSLLTKAELRAAVGITGTSQDTALAALGERVAAALASVCDVPASGVTPPTFRLETITETFLPACRGSELRLSRWPIVSVASATEAGSAVDAEDYEIDARWLRRLSGGDASCWSGSRIVVVYDAGWAIVPYDLKLAAIKTAKMLWSEDGPGSWEPGVKRVKTEGVDEVERWVGPSDDPLLSQEIIGSLTRFIYRTV